MPTDAGLGFESELTHVDGGREARLHATIEPNGEGQFRVRYNAIDEATGEQLFDRQLPGTYETPDAAFTAMAGINPRVGWYSEIFVVNFDDEPPIEVVVPRTGDSREETDSFVPTLSSDPTARTPGISADGVPKGVLEAPASGGSGPRTRARRNKAEGPAADGRGDATPGNELGRPGFGSGPGLGSGPGGSGPGLSSSPGGGEPGPGVGPESPPSFWSGVFNALIPSFNLSVGDLAMAATPFSPGVLDGVRSGIALWGDIFEYATSRENSDAETQAALNLLRRIPMVQWHEGTERLARLFYQEEPLNYADAAELVDALKEALAGGAGTAAAVTGGTYAISRVRVRLGGAYSEVKNSSVSHRDHIPPVDSYVRSGLLPAGRSNASYGQLRDFASAARVGKTKHRRHSTTGSGLRAQWQRHRIAMKMRRGKFEEAFDMHAREYFKKYPKDKQLHRAIAEAKKHYMENVVPILRNIWPEG